MTSPTFNCCSGIGPVASCTISASALTTIGLMVAACTLEPVAALVICAVAAVFAGCFTYASITAFIEITARTYEVTVSEYFNAIGKHMMAIVPAVLTFIMTTIGSAAVQGAAEGVGQNIRRRIGGEDTTVRVVRQ